jgi:hypothetical protein
MAAAAVEGLTYIEEIANIVERASLSGSGKALQAGARQSIVESISRQLEQGLSPLAAATGAMENLFGISNSQSRIDERSRNRLRDIERERSTLPTMTPQQEAISRISRGIGSRNIQGQLPSAQNEISRITHGIGGHNIQETGPQGEIVVNIPDSDEEKESSENQPLLSNTGNDPSLGLRNRAGRRPVVDQTIIDMNNANPFSQPINRPIRPIRPRPSRSGIKKGAAAAGAAAVGGIIAGSAQTSGDSQQSTPAQDTPSQNNPPIDNTSAGSDPSYDVKHDETKQNDPNNDAPINIINDNSSNSHTDSQNIPDSGVRGQFKIPKSGVYYPYKSLLYTQAMLHNMFL